MINKIGLKSIAIILFTMFFLIPFQSSFAGYDDFTVNVPNAQGGYTAIVIKKSGDGYIGPQGEYYAQFPSVAQLQAMYSLGTPPPTVITPVTYVQPQVQSVVTYQVVNQEPYDDRDEEYVERPVYQPNIIEVEDTSHPKEENDWTFFEFKKNKKSQQPQINNQNTMKPNNPSSDNKWQSQKQSQETNNPSRDTNKGQSSQKQKADFKAGQGDSAKAKNTQDSTEDKSNPQNKAGSSP